MSIYIKIIDYGKWKTPVFGAIIQLIDRPSEYAINIGIPIVETSKIIDAFIGSTYPNPLNPKKPELKLRYAYPIIKAGIYRYKFSLTAHNGKPGFDINNNEKIPTIYMNPNPKSKYFKQYFADHVDLHSAWSDIWRGSGACTTVMKGCWKKMRSHFNDGDEGDIEILRINP